MKRFRGGLVFKAHRLLHPSTLGLAVIKKKKKKEKKMVSHLKEHNAAVTWIEIMDDDSHAVLPYSRANLKSIFHRCHPIPVVFVWELT